MKEELNEYTNYLQSILDDHSSELLEETKLPSNRKEEILNAFFKDFDEKSDKKATELILRYNSESDRLELNTNLLYATREYNQKFKELIMNS